MLKTVVLLNIFVGKWYSPPPPPPPQKKHSNIEKTLTFDQMNAPLLKKDPNLLINSVHRVSLTKSNQQAVCKVFPDTAKSKCSFIKIRVARGQSKSVDDWMSLLTGLYVFEVQQKAVQRAQGELRKMPSILLKHIHSWNYAWFRITLMTKEKLCLLILTNAS